MSCPTCDHTMQSISGPYVHWCPRCGTIRYGEDGQGVHVGIAVPKLVERCREFQLQLAVGTGLGSQYASKPLKELWHRLGIAESINVPERRPT